MITESGGASHDVPTFPQRRGNPLDPAPLLARLRREQPVSRVRIWDDSTPWLITRFDDCRRLLKDDRLSNNTDLPGYPHHVAGMVALRSKRSFAQMDPPEHSVHRQMLTGEFAINRIDALRPKIEAIVELHLDAMAAQGPPVDLVESLALPVPSLGVSVLLGVPSEDHEFFQRSTHQILSKASTLEESRAATGALWGYLDELMTRKATQPGDDVLTRLGEKVAEGELDRSEAVSDAFLLLVAGHETTASQIALGTIVLLENPSELARVTRSEIGWPEAIEEMLRYMTIVQSGRRRVAVGDIEIEGHTIRAGDGVIIATDAANRDPSAYPEPDMFDVGRDARHHMAFGYGVHQCIGARFARAELEITFDKLFSRFPGLHLAESIENLEFAWDAMFYGVRQVPVGW